MPPEDAGEPIGCVATTFTFSPVFFEEECLGRFLKLETDPKEDGPLYLVEREEKLAQVVCAAVLVDQHHCKGSRSLRWDLLPARLPDGVLHAKVSLLRWSQLIRIIVASANLTEDGYRRNQEVFGVLDYKPRGAAPISCLMQIVDFLRQAGTHSHIGLETSSPELMRWNSFLEGVVGVGRDWGVETAGRRARDVLVQAVLTGSDRASAFERLSQVWPGSGPPVKAYVFSPFFDPPEAANHPAEELWGFLRRRGEAEVNFYVSGEEVSGENRFFLHAPESLQLAQPTGRPGVLTKFYRLDLEADRPFHAKGIWVEDDRWILYMIGSSNFTSPGLGLNRNGNMEANLAYCVDCRRNAKAYRMLQKSFPEGEGIKKDVELGWQPRSDEGEDSGGDIVVLPRGFGSAIYDFNDEQGASIALTFAEPTPKGWALWVENDEGYFLGESNWLEKGSPENLSLPWKYNRPPSGFWVNWEDSNGKAWWPVNIASVNSLPPPEELKNLPLEVLIDILTSARPLHRALQSYLNRKDKGKPPGEETPPILDPHKRVDTSQFLLQRTRRVSWAINALRERIERPAATKECLNWRLRGPVGVMVLAEALIREAQSDEEKAFMLTELALELARIKPKESQGCLAPERVNKEIRDLIAELRGRIPSRGLGRVRNLKQYLDSVFEIVLK